MLIYKFPLSVDFDKAEDIKMPAGATVLALQVQRGVPCIWATVEQDAPKIRRRFRTYGTGHPMEDADRFPYYVGTYQLPELPSLVCHVFTDRIDRPISPFEGKR